MGRNLPNTQECYGVNAKLVISGADNTAFVSQWQGFGCHH